MDFIYWLIPQVTSATYFFKAHNLYLNCLIFPISRSFAYLTVRDRLPTILTKVIDTLHRNKDNFFKEYGEVYMIFDFYI